MNTNEWEKEFDRVFVDENMWKSDDEFTANVPIDNIKKFISIVLARHEEEAYKKGFIAGALAEKNV